MYFARRPQTLDSPALQALDEAGRNGEAQVGPPLGHARQHVAFQFRPQPAANRLDFRQFRHGRNF